MDYPSGLRQTASAGKIFSIDVSRLDKINAIPNKTTDNILMDGLCQDDKLYLDSLMNDSSSESESDDHTQPSHRMSSAWSPMAQSPIITMSGTKGTKRMRRMKSPYAITLSLEDISYIRPSWGMSKRVKRIEVNTTKKRKRSITATGGGRLALARERRMLREKTMKQFCDDDEDEDQENLENAQKEQAFSRFGFDQLYPMTMYHAFLLFIIILLVFLVSLSCFVDFNRQQERVTTNKIRIDERMRVFEIFRSRRDDIDLSMEDTSQIDHRQRVLTVHFGRGVPSNLKSHGCSCVDFDQEAMKFGYETSASNSGECYACLDWSMRANLRITVRREPARAPPPPVRFMPNNGESSATTPNLNPVKIFEPTLQCYDIKWQSYDALATPLVDCIQIGQDEQWFGLGDVLTAREWPINRHTFNKSALESNLRDEFERDWDSLGHGEGSSRRKLRLGSYTNFTLFSSSAFFIGNVRSDFQLSILSQATNNSQILNIRGPLANHHHNQPRRNSSSTELCLMASCTERCTNNWHRNERLKHWQSKNNILEYQICSASNWRNLVSRQLQMNSEHLALNYLAIIPTMVPVANNSADSIVQLKPLDKTIESVGMPTREVNSYDQPILNAGRANRLKDSSGNNNATDMGRGEPLTASGAGDITAVTGSSNLATSVTKIRSQQSIQDGIGLIDRTIFATSMEFIPTLDGKTLRQFVDNIIKLNLKTSSILAIDTRWQTSVGSLKLNSALFPKAKLLFEILHNKGFKVVLTIKPYIDTDLGISVINGLSETRRLYMREKSFISPDSLDTLDDSVAGASSRTNGNSSNGTFIIRRVEFFKFRNETLKLSNETQDRDKVALLSRCKESTQANLCAFLDLTNKRNRIWLIDMIKRSPWLTQEADGILIAGAHPDGFRWEDHYRDGLYTLIDDLFYKEERYIIPQWTGNFGYMQLAPRQRTWHDLRSVLESVLNLGSLGFSLVHPGSVWGDLNGVNQQSDGGNEMLAQLVNQADQQLQQQLLNGAAFGNGNGPTDAELELIIRWLQLSIFMPILQFKDLAPIEKFNLYEQVQNLVKIRRLHVVPEIRKHLPFTPLIGDAPSRQAQATTTINRENQQPLLPVIRRVSHSFGDNSGSESIVAQEFSIGTDILVAPILTDGQRQRDIYLPSGYWRDELRQTNVRGGKWLRNYPVELYEVAWFTRARR